MDYIWYLHIYILVSAYNCIREILQVSHYLHSWKWKGLGYMPWEFFAFPERYLHHLLRIFRFTSLVRKICGLAVKDTVICNCTALENVSGIKWSRGQLIRHHWSKETIFLGSFFNKRFNELSQIIGSFLSNRRAFAMGGFDTPKVFLSRSLIPLSDDGSRWNFER